MSFSIPGAAALPQSSRNSTTRYARASGSPTSQAFVRLARAVAYEAVGHDDASLARADATLALSALGLDARGWDTVLRSAVYGEVGVPSDG